MPEHRAIGHEFVVGKTLRYVLLGVFIAIIDCLIAYKVLIFLNIQFKLLWDLGQGAVMLLFTAWSAPVIFVIVFVVFLPYSFVRRKHKSCDPFHIVKWTIIILVVEVVPFSWFLFGLEWDGAKLFFMHYVPVAVATAVSAPLMLTLLNNELRKTRSPLLKS